MSGQVSRGSAGEYQADERAGVARPLSASPADGERHPDRHHGPHRGCRGISSDRKVWFKFHVGDPRLRVRVGAVFPRLPEPWW